MNSKIKAYLQKKDWAQYLLLSLKIMKNRKKKIGDIEEYLVKDYENYYGIRPNLISPQKYSEFLLWQKINMHDDIAALLTDKITSKKIVELLFGEEIFYPKTINVFEKTSEITYDNLPNECVIKCNHNSGYIFHFIKHENKKYTIKNLRDKHGKKYRLFFVRKILKKLLKVNYYHKSFEWNYEGIVPRIFVEEYLNVKDLRDYKFYMSMGNLISFHVVTNRQIDERNNFFDSQLNPLNYWADVPPAKTPPSLPENIMQMIEIAKRLSANYPAVRIDLYNLNGKIYFSEVTFFHMGGHLEFKEPVNFDELMGEGMRLPPKNKWRRRQ